jgi:ectoine hydroxylase-related dioxygenase (phytanoyl-CoA dioxygenase family)
MLEPAVFPVSDEDVRAYQRDGAVVIRQVMSKPWLDLLAEGLEEIRGNPGGMTSILSSRAGEGETLVDQYASLRIEKLQRFMKGSPAARVAAAVMKAPAAHYVLDQVFYKASGTLVNTAFHQDTPYLRVTGHDLARTWICCDHSPPEATIGVVRGSHLWNVTYRPIGSERSDTKTKSVGKDFSYTAAEFDPSLPALPNIEGHLDSFDIMRWDIQPGDVLVFNGNAIHGTIDKCELSHPRRVLAILWAGAEARYMRRPGHSIPDLASLKGRDIESDEYIKDRADIFDRCWPVDA